MRCRKIVVVAIAVGIVFLASCGGALAQEPDIDARVQALEGQVKSLQEELARRDIQYKADIERLQSAQTLKSEISDVRVEVADKRAEVYEKTFNSVLAGVQFYINALIGGLSVFLALAAAGAFFWVGRYVKDVAQKTMVREAEATMQSVAERTFTEWDDKFKKLHTRAMKLLGVSSND